jgi:hypothetical protein
MTIIDKRRKEGESMAAMQLKQQSIDVEQEICVINASKSPNG